MTNDNDESHSPVLVQETHSLPPFTMNDNEGDVFSSSSTERERDTTLLYNVVVVVCVEQCICYHTLL